MPLYLRIDNVYSSSVRFATHEEHNPPPRQDASPTTRVRAMAITMYTTLLLIIRGVSYTCADRPLQEGRNSNHYWPVI